MTVQRPQNELEDVDRAIEQLTFGAGRLEPAAAGARPKPRAFERIVVAVDGSPTSDLAVAWARRFAEAFGARVWAVHVVPPPDLTDHYLETLGALAVEPPGDLAAELEEAGRAALDTASGQLTRGGLQVETALAHGRAAPGIAAFAGEVGADLVVVGSHSRGPVQRALLGSVADGVKNTVQASVLIAKSPAPGPRLLLATDGSRASKRAVALGLRVSRAWKLPATVLHVFEPLMFGSEAELEAMEEHAFGKVDPLWTDPRVRFDIEVGNPAERIVARAAEARAGLVVMGCRGLSGVPSLLAGSVSNRVAHEASASVLLVKGS